MQRFLIIIRVLCILTLPTDMVWGRINDMRTVTASRLDEGDRIHLDGHLSETSWKGILPASGFLQQEPDEGSPASERTEVFILYDRNHLYIGAVLYDDEPDRILAYQKQRDADLVTDDRFRWILDTFRDGRTGYFFEVNPAGLMSDGLLGRGIGFEPNKSWDGIWEVRVTRIPDGWSAEIRIPFRTLNFDPARKAWGINFQRTIRRKNEEVLWSGHLRNQGLYQTAHAGQLIGLEDISQGIGLEVIPYASTAWRRMPDIGTTDTYLTDIGFDIQYSLTPGLRAALTVNTDFAEVEVDERRVNLTRFPLYFPEKRDFFLEGSSVYDFAVRNGAYPFFSRRIGLDDDGVPVPVVFGLRLGGHLARTELGFLQVRTHAHSEQPGEDFTVARVKGSLFDQSSLGVIFTRRAAVGVSEDTSPEDRYTVGFDLDLKTSRFLGDKNFQFEAFAVWHTDPDAGGFSNFNDFSCRGIRINYPNDILRVHTSYREFGNAYDPAVGFNPRNGMRRLNPGLFYLPRPASIPWIRKFEFGFNHLQIWDIDGGGVQTRWTDVMLLGVHFESGDILSVHARPVYERLKDPFTIHDGITLPVKTYRTLEWTFNGNTAGHRRFALGWQFSRGSFWSGHRTTIGKDVHFKPASGVGLILEYEKNDVDLMEGDFSTHLVRFLAEWHLNPWIAIIGNLQFDDVTDTMGLFVRLRWIFRPGSDIYFVYTHNWIQDPAQLNRHAFNTYSRAATIKINYTHRF